MRKSNVSFLKRSRFGELLPKVDLGVDVDVAANCDHSFDKISMRPSFIG